MIKNKPVNTGTNNEGEANVAVSTAVIDNNIAGNNNSNNNNNNRDCCGGCCSYKPNTYENGLYTRDINPLMSFLCVYAIFSGPGYIILPFFESFRYGSYVVIFANIATVILSSIYACKVGQSFVGYGFILIGVLYIITHIIYSIFLKDYGCTTSRYGVNEIYYTSNYAYDYWWGNMWDNCWRIQRPYFVGRGLFIGIIYFILGGQLTGNIKYINTRQKVIRLLLFPLLIYSILVGSIILNGWYFQIVTGCMSFILGVCCIIGFFVSGPYSNNGGCNCLVALGTIMWVAYIGVFLQNVGLTAGFRSSYFGYYFYFQANTRVDVAFVILWELCPVFVAAGNLWVLLKAMHPCLAKCNDQNIPRSTRNNTEIELQVNQPNPQYSHVNDVSGIQDVVQDIPSDLMNNNESKDGCCDTCCAKCCPSCVRCCKAVPFNYENGLYSKDINFFIIFIVIFVLTTIYQEISLKQYESFKAGGYIAFIGLIIVLVACIAYTIAPKIYKATGILFVISGIIYFIGYFLSGILLRDLITPCPPTPYSSYYSYPDYKYCNLHMCARQTSYCRGENSYYGYRYGYYNYWDNPKCNEFFGGYKDCWSPQRPYFISRGFYIGFILCIIGIQIYFNNTDNKCFKGRVLTSKILMIPMIIYCIFIGSIVAHDWGYQIVFGCLSFALGLSLIIGLCAVNKNNNNGKCGMVVYGSIMWAFYGYSLALSLAATIGIRANQSGYNTFNKNGHNAAAVLFWELGIIFPSIPNMISILRAIHPSLTKGNCDCCR